MPPRLPTSRARVPPVPVSETKASIAARCTREPITRAAASARRLEQHGYYGSAAQKRALTP